MSKKIRTEAVDSLFEAVLSLKNKEECYIFFEDICTINELLSLSQRFEVAKMLREQKIRPDRRSLIRYRPVPVKMEAMAFMSWRKAIHLPLSAGRCTVM